MRIFQYCMMLAALAVISLSPTAVTFAQAPDSCFTADVNGTPFVDESGNSIEVCWPATWVGKDNYAPTVFPEPEPEEPVADDVTPDESGDAGAVDSEVALE